jgi:replicative DNA helicase
LSTKENSNDYSKIQEAMHELSDAPIYIEDKSSFNIMQMKAMARRLQAENGLGLIIIDYLQLIQPRSNATSMVQQMTEISRALKGLAKELNVPVISLSQLSRAVEKRTPQIPRLSDLRESGALEQDADVVLLMYREEYYREDTERQNITDLIIAKHRNGPTGKVELYFDENTTSFRSLDKKHTN